MNKAGLPAVDTVLDELEKLALSVPDRLELPAGSRLVWVVKQASSQEYRAYPRLDVPTAEGGSACLEIPSEFAQLPFLNAQERRLCTLLEGPPDRPFLPQSALPELVGNPAVFRDRQLDSALEIVRGRPELRLSWQGDGYLLELTPPMSAEQDLLVQVESESRLRIYQACSLYRKIGRLVGSGLRLPLEQLGKRRDLLQKLARLAPLTGEVDSLMDLPEVDTDPTPVVQLRRRDPGLEVEIKVQPLPQGPLYYPGEGNGLMLAAAEGRPHQGRRNLALERERAQQLLEECPHLGGWCCLLNERETALETLETLHHHKEQIRLRWPDGEPVRLLEFNPDFLKFNLQSRGDWFILDAILKCGDEIFCDLGSLFEQLEQSRFLATLEDSTFLALPAESRGRLQRLYQLLEPVGMAYAFHAYQAAEIHQVIKPWHAPTREEFIRLLVLAELAERSYNPEPDKRLRSHQEEGLDWLRNKVLQGQDACLADPPGTGKTMQVATLFLEPSLRGTPLVICGSSALDAWNEQLVSHSTLFKPQAPEQLVPGEECDLFTVVLVCYDQLEELVSQKREWSVVVLDEPLTESHRPYLESKALEQLAAGSRLVLTGAPLDRRPEQLYRLFATLRPSLCSPAGERQPPSDERLQMRLASQLLCRAREQLDLGTQNVERSCRFSQAQRECYQALLAEALATDQDDTQTWVDHITKLRRCCCLTGLAGTASTESPKLELLKELLEELLGAGLRVQLASRFTEDLDKARELVPGEGVSYLLVEGNAVAEPADCLIYLEPGQRLAQEPALVYHLLTRDTIEAPLYLLAQSEPELSAALDAGDSTDELDPKRLRRLLDDSTDLSLESLTELMRRGPELLAEEAQMLLGYFRGHPEQLESLLVDPDEYAEDGQTWAASWLAGKLAEARFIEPLLDALRRTNENITALALAHLGEPALEPLLKLAYKGRPDDEFLWLVSEALSRLGLLHPQLSDRVADGLLAAIQAPATDPTLRAEAVCALLELGHQEALATVERDWQNLGIDEEIVDRPVVQRQLLGREPQPSTKLSLDAELLPRHRVQLRRVLERLSQAEREGMTSVDWVDRFRADLHELTAEDSQEPEIRLGRNERCHCGSGKKYKKCCLRQDEKRQRRDPLLQQMSQAVWNGRGYAMLPSEQLRELPRELVTAHLELLTGRGSEVKRRLRDETNPYLLLAGMLCFSSLGRTQEARELALLLTAAEPHPAINPVDIKHFPTLEREFSRHRTRYAYDFEMAVQNGLQGTALDFLTMVNYSEVARPLLERVWNMEPWSGWTAAAFAEWGLLCRQDEPATEFLDKALERMQGQGSLHPLLPDTPCTPDLLEAYRRDLEETREFRLHLKSLFSESRNRPHSPSLRAWEALEVERELHRARFSEQAGDEPQEGLQEYLRQRESLEQRSAELLCELLDSQGMLAAATYQGGILWLSAHRPTPDRAREVPLDLENLDAHPTEDPQKWALRRTVAELGMVGACLKEGPWAEFRALHLVLPTCEPDDLLALAETTLSEVDSKAAPAYVLTTRTRDLLRLGQGATLSLEASAEESPPLEETEEPEERELSYADMLRRVLGRLLRMSKVGAAHTDANHFFTGIPASRKGELKTLFELLVKDDYIRLKPTAKELHISLEPRRLPAIKQFLEGGPPPPGRIQDYLAEN